MGPKLYFGFYFDMPPITLVVNKAQRVLEIQARRFRERVERNLSLVSAQQLFSEARLCL